MTPAPTTLRRTAPLLCALLVATPRPAPGAEAEPIALSLLEAVRLTLEQDPEIRLQEVRLQQGAGRLQEASGRFDATLRGTASYEHVVRELSAGTKLREREGRERFDEVIREGSTLEADIPRAEANLQDPAVRNDPRRADLARGIQDPTTRRRLQSVQIELVLLNDLLARTVDALVRDSLLDLREDVIRSVTQDMRERLEEFHLEELKRRRALLGDAPENEWRDHGRLHLDLTRPLRSGVTLAPFLDLDYTATNFVGKPDTDPDKGGMGVEPLYLGEAGLEIVFPLARGRGSAEAAAEERAARERVRALEAELAHRKAESVLRTVLAYWEVKALAEQAVAARASVSLQQGLLAITRALIQARQMSRPEESRALASLAEAQGRLAGLQRQLGDARVELARAIGLAVEDAPALPLASEPFPSPQQAEQAWTDAQIAALARAGADRRADRRGSLLDLGAARLLARGAELGARPKLDLVGRAWGTSVGETDPRPGSWVVRSGRVSLDVELPFGNRERRGLLARQQATLRQAQIATAELERGIALKVREQAHALWAAAEQLRQAELSAAEYEKAVRSEQARLQVGESSLLDAVVTEQQATSAQLARIAAHRDYAQALARLRFESGLLLRVEDGHARIRHEDLTGLPEATP